MSVSINFIAGNSGKEQLVINGHRFCRNRSRNDKSYWACSQKAKHGCPCTAITCNQTKTLLSSSKEHCHTADQRGINAKIAISKMRSLARAANYTPTNILSETLSELDILDKLRLPSINAMKQIMYREHKKAFPSPPIPTTLADIDLPEHYTYTLGVEKECMLLYDAGKLAEKRIMIFGTQRNVIALERSTSYFCDGTFKTAPDIFTQLFTLHGLIPGGYHVPLIYAFLPGKTLKSYEQVFTVINSLGTLSPQNIMMDFESGMRGAAANIFPNANIDGCHFHFGQANLKKLRKLGLAVDYNEDECIRMWVRRLHSLAFIKPTDVIDGFDAIQEELPTILDEYSDYFQRTWIGQRTRNSRKQPLYNIESWNCHHATLNGKRKTNNNIEGWHSGFSKRYNGKTRPNIYDTITSIQLEQNLTYGKMVDSLRGMPARKRPSYRDLKDQQIIRVLKNYDQYSLFELCDWIGSILDTGIYRNI